MRQQTVSLLLQLANLPILHSEFLKPSCYLTKKKIASVGAFTVIFSWCSNIFENAIKVAALLNIFQPCVSKDGSRHGNNSITYTKKVLHISHFFFS